MKQTKTMCQVLAYLLMTLGILGLMCAAGDAPSAWYNLIALALSLATLWGANALLDEAKKIKE